MLLKYVCLAILKTFFTVFCLGFVNWWAPLFADSMGNLPKWLAWVGTFDNPLQGDTYIARVAWLYRNPAAGFGYWVCGIPFNPMDWTVTKSEFPSTGYLDFSAFAKSGAWCYRHVGPYLAIETGWKAEAMYDHLTGAWKTAPWGPEWRIPITFSIVINFGGLWKTL